MKVYFDTIDFLCGNVFGCEGVSIAINTVSIANQVLHLAHNNSVTFGKGTVSQ